MFSGRCSYLKRAIRICICLLLILAVITLRISVNYSSVCENYAEHGVKAKLTREINQLISNALDSNAYASELIEIRYFADGRIGSIEADTAMINTVCLNLSDTIQEHIESSNKEFGIPLGNLLGIKYLSGLGPSINVRIVSVGNVEYEIKSELLESGINQTLYRLYVVFKANAYALAPFNQSDVSIETKIIIAECLIIGEIPDTIISPFE